MPDGVDADPQHSRGDRDDPTLRHNRGIWSEVSTRFERPEAEQRWGRSEVRWGLFGVPEGQLHALGQIAGADVVELACGMGHLCAQLGRLGARPVGVDLSAEQLDGAAELQGHFGESFPLVEASAEEVPLRSSSFDVVVSEYGAAPWCRPGRWLAEAARLLRPCGRLVFLTNSVLAGLCVPDEGGHAGTELLRPQPVLRDVEWPGGGIEHHPGHGDWVRELRRAGFVVEALHELYAPEGAVTPENYEVVTAGWARNWPAEDLWVAQLF